LILQEQGMREEDLSRPRKPAGFTDFNADWLTLCASTMLDSYEELQA
jgi:hypothetical protein